MIIVAGTFDVAPEDRDAFLAGRAAQVARSRQEPGCLEYGFSVDPEVPGRVRLFERWESEEALEAHIAGLATATPDPSAPSPVPVLARELVRYRVSEAVPMG